MDSNEDDFISYPRHGNGRHRLMKYSLVFEIVLKPFSRTSVWTRHRVRTMDRVTLTTITTTIIASVMEQKEETVKTVSGLFIYFHL